MKILVLTTAYDTHCATPLAAELATELAAEHEVQVLATDWNLAPGTPSKTINGNGYRAVVKSPVGFGKMGKLVLSSLKLAWLARRLGPFDKVIAFSPAITLWAPLLIAQGAKTVYITDFFPYHNCQLGMIPKAAEAPLAAVESFLFRRCDTLAVMSPRGVDYLRDHYQLSGQAVKVVPLWSGGFKQQTSTRSETRRRHRLPLGATIALFGGQIERGRGIESIVEASKLLPDVHFLFVGSGSLQHLVTGSPNLQHIAAVPREDYLAIASACDVGIVATVAGVDVPTFPSKTIDYAYSDLAIAAAVEESSDYPAFIEEQGLGNAVVAGDSAALAQVIADTVKQGHTDIRAIASRVFSARRAARQFLGLA